MKARRSQRCAGGCGHLFRVGHHAIRAHRTLWCGSCWSTHRERCGAHPTATRSPAPELEGVLF